MVATAGYRHRSEDVAEVGHRRVHPDVQRRGYAERLMAAVEDRAAADGFERLVLATREDLTAARALYEGLGYERLARIPHPETGAELIRYGADPD